MVTLVPVGFLKEFVGGREWLELDAGPSVAEMLVSVGIPPAVVAAVLREDELVTKEYRPRDGERIKVMAVVGGG